ncbi:hypothetical protein BMS3Bbin15_00769 [archaeon BMS3Bbin15]|nr:hypothetical protein BMS3Bbin15_00769 [archaeon BMS3Bbin15]
MYVNKLYNYEEEIEEVEKMSCVPATVEKHKKSCMTK